MEFLNHILDWLVVYGPTVVLVASLVVAVLKIIPGTPLLLLKVFDLFAANWDPIYKAILEAVRKRKGSPLPVSTDPPTRKPVVPPGG
jgi:hypothetical protein